MDGGKKISELEAQRAEATQEKKGSALGSLTLGGSLLVLPFAIAALESAQAQDTVTPEKSDALAFSVQANLGKPIEGRIALNTDQAGRTFQDRSYVFRVAKPPSGGTGTTSTTASTLTTVPSTAEATLERPAPGHHAFVQNFVGKLKVKGAPVQTSFVFGTTVYFRAADGSSVAAPVQLTLDGASSQTEVEFTTKFNSLDGKTPGGPIRGLLRVVQAGNGPRFVVKLADDSDAAVTAVSLEIVAPPESGWPQKSALALEPSGTTLRVELTSDEAGELRDAVGMRNGTTGPFSLYIGDKVATDVYGNLTVSSEDAIVPEQSLGFFNEEGLFVPLLELEVTHPADLDDQVELGISTGEGDTPTASVDVVLDVEASPRGVFEGELPEATADVEVKAAVTLFDRNGKALETEACVLSLTEKAKCKTSLGGTITVARFGTGSTGTVRPILRYTGVGLNSQKTPRVSSTYVTSPQYPFALSLQVTPTGASTTVFSMTRTWHVASASGKAISSAAFLQEEGQSIVDISIPGSGLAATTTATHCLECEVRMEATKLDFE